MLVRLIVLGLQIFTDLISTKNEDEMTMWSFGYGSNMDVKALEAKKS